MLPKSPIASCSTPSIAQAHGNTRPLVVDLDGTLLRSDMLVESGFAFLRTQPLRIFKLLTWLAAGKAHLKERLAQSIDIDVTALPYNAEVITLLQRERAAGRQIVLATASHKIYADQIASHLQLFDRVLATQDNVNLSASRKRDALLAEYGEQEFDYVGNSHDDVPVWASASSAYVVNPQPGVLAKAAKAGNVAQIISDLPNPLMAWAKALRFHQWMKNLLIFVPLLASHQLHRVDSLLHGLLAFIFFGFCASSVYLLNDLLDLADDRHHPTKRNRPFAAGNLSIKAGAVAVPILLIAAFWGAWQYLPPKFTLALTSYYVLTLLYSLSFKRKVMVDVIVLAMLYTLRIIAGTYAFGVSLTFWMLAFSMFIFLSLALVKRYAELLDRLDSGETGKARGRGYYPDDLQMISSLGSASGYLSVMVLALYIQDQSTIALYRHPQWIWMACPLLLYWISRTWLLTHRGKMHDDPVVFAVTDKVSILVGILFGAIFWLAT